MRMDVNLEETTTVELLKTKVKVVNKLNDAISEVQVCYAESSKGTGLSYAYNYKTVDIESEESINWKSVLKFEAIQSLHNVNSTEYIYFGNNRGYWQVYFKYEGNDYKINKNNANFNLAKRDEEEPVVIEILSHEKGLYANFKVLSGHDYFWMKRGSPLERGVTVSISNKLRATISEVRLVYAESTTSDVDIETEKNIVSIEEVRFEDQTVESNQVTSSPNRLVFSYHTSFWQLYFKYEDNFHKLNKNDAKYDLKSRDNERTLVITLGPQAEPRLGGIPVEFNVNSRTCVFMTKIEESVQNRRGRCRDFLTTLSSNSHFTEYRDVRVRIKQALKTISGCRYDDHAIGYSRLFIRLRDFNIDELITDETSKLKFSPKVYNADMIRSLKELKRLLEEDKRLGSLLREQLNEVERLSAGHSGDYRTDNQFLYGFGIATEMITLVGINEMSLIVKLGADVVCGLNLTVFERALDEELGILDLSLKPPKEMAGKKELHSCLVHAFLREFDKYELITRDTIKTMTAIASALHGNTQNVAITKTTGGVVGIAGGVLLIVGLALEPLTLGASTPLVITGITLVASSGALNIGASIGDAVARSKIVASLKQSLNEKVLLKTLSSLTEVIGSDYFLSQTLDLTSSASTDFAENLGITAGTVGKVARVGTVAGLTTGLRVAGEGGLQALRNAFRFGAVAVGIVFDLLTVFDSSFTLATGAKSDIGYKWAYDAMKLEQDLKETKERINRYIIDYVR